MHDVVGGSPIYKKRKREREREREREILKSKKKKGTYYQMIEGAHGKKRIRNCT
jgi:hypothetical protein